MNTNRRSRGPILILLLCLSALPLFAQAPPAFLIERIDVRNVKRASPQVVRSESLLREGQAYTEQQLQDAQSRIRRLPFVLDVEFSLKKGSQRDVYVLVMDVDEASPFFVGIDHVTYPPDNGRGTETSTFADFGFRWFVGEYGQLHASLGGDLEDRPRALSLGYTQYNLLGRSIFFSLTGSTDLLENVDSLGVSGVLGVPLRGNHALRMQVAGHKSDRRQFDQDSDSESIGASLGWLYDTSNDALFPTDGTKLGAGVSRSRDEYTAFSLQFPPAEVTASREMETTATSLQLNGTKYWPVRELDAFVFDAQVSRAQRSEAAMFVPTVPDFVPMKSTNLGASVQLGYSGSFWGLDKTRRIGDLRYNAGLRAWTNRTGFDGVGIPDRNFEELGLVTGLAHRNRWGLIRFSVAWSLASDSDAVRP